MRAAHPSPLAASRRNSERASDVSDRQQSAAHSEAPVLYSCTDEWAVSSSPFWGCPGHCPVLAVQPTLFATGTAAHNDHSLLIVLLSFAPTTLIVLFMSRFS